MSALRLLRAATGRNMRVLRLDDEGNATLQCRACGWTTPHDVVAVRYEAGRGFADPRPPKRNGMARSMHMTPSKADTTRSADSATAPIVANAAGGVA